MKKGIAIVCNIFFPGIGTLVLGRIGEGITQIVLFVIAIILDITLVFSVIGIPLMVGVWIWGIVTAAMSGGNKQRFAVTNSVFVSEIALPIVVPLYVGCLLKLSGVNAFEQI